MEEEKKENNQDKDNNKDNNKDNSNVNNDENILNQLEGIENSIKETQPLIGSSKSLTNLLSYYEDNELPGFLEGIKFLSTKYPRMRAVRGDGNCFYRYIILFILFIYFFD